MTFEEALNQTIQALKTKRDSCWAELYRMKETGIKEGDRRFDSLTERAKSFDIAVNIAILLDFDARGITYKGGM